LYCFSAIATSPRDISRFLLKYFPSCYTYFYVNVLENFGSINTTSAENDNLIQTATTTTNIYNTIVHLGFNVYDTASGVSGKGTTNFLENVEEESHQEETISSRVVLLNEQNNSTEQENMEPDIADVDSGNYEDNQNTNISKSNGYTASDDEEMEENPEPESPDPDYVYFGEMSLTDLYSMPGFRKDLHDEIADQGYCPLYVAESNLCQYPELLPNEDELGTFSAGRVLPNRRIEDVYGEVLRKRPDSFHLKYTFYILECGFAIDFYDHRSKCCRFRMAYANDGLSFIEANVVLTVTEGELAFYTKESGLEKYEECVWEYDKVGLYWYLNKDQLPAHIFVQASVHYRDITNEATMKESYAKLKWEDDENENQNLPALSESDVDKNSEQKKTRRMDAEEKYDDRRGPSISKADYNECADPENDDDDNDVKQEQKNSEEKKIVRKKGNKDGVGSLGSGGSKVSSSIFLRKAVYGKEYILATEYEYFIVIIKQGISLLKSPKITSALSALTGAKKYHQHQEIVYYIIYQLGVYFDQVLMIETKSSQRKKDYIFLELNVAAVGKGISEVKDLHETYTELVNPIMHSSGYNVFATKVAGKVRDEANNIEFCAIENTIKEVWSELDGMRWYNMTTTEGYGIINVSCLTATRIIYFLRKQFKSLLNFKFYADIGVGIPYLVASMATMFEHVNCVGIDLPETIDSIKHIMKYITNGKCQILNSISFVSQDILKCNDRFLADLKKCQVITNFIGLPLIDEYVIKHVLPESSCKVIMFRVARRTFPKVHHTWLKGLGFKSIKSSIKGTLAIQSEPEYSNFDVRIYVYDEDPNVFVPLGPTIKHKVGFGDETGVPTDDDLKSFIVSENDREAEYVPEHFEKVNAFKPREMFEVSESADIISRLKRELPALLEDDATFSLLKHAFQESLKKRAKRNGDGSCILCGIKPSINLSDEVGRIVVTDATDLSKNCYDHDSLWNRSADTGSKTDGGQLEEFMETEWLSTNSSDEKGDGSPKMESEGTAIELSNTKQASEQGKDGMTINGPTIKNDGDDVPLVKTDGESVPMITDDCDTVPIMKNDGDVVPLVKIVGDSVPLINDKGDGEHSARKQIPSDEKKRNPNTVLQRSERSGVDMDIDCSIINQTLAVKMVMEIVRVETDNVRLSLDCNLFAPDGIKVTNTDAIDKYVDEGLIKVIVSLKYSGGDFQDNVCKGDGTCALQLVDVLPKLINRDSMTWSSEWYYRGKPKEYKSWIDKLEEWANNDGISSDLKSKLVRVVKWGRSKSRKSMSYENWCELNDVAALFPKSVKTTSFWLNSAYFDRMAPGLYNSPEGTKWLTLLWYCQNEYEGGFASVTVQDLFSVLKNRIIGIVQESNQTIGGDDFVRHFFPGILPVIEVEEVKLCITKLKAQLKALLFVEDLPKYYEETFRENYARHDLLERFVINFRQRLPRACQAKNCDAKNLAIMSPKKIPSTPKKRKEKVTVLSPSPNVKVSTKQEAYSSNPRQKRRLNTKSRNSVRQEFDFKSFTSFKYPAELDIVSFSRVRLKLAMFTYIYSGCCYYNGKRC